MPGPDEWVDAALERGRAQLGYVTTGQLLAIGLSRRGIQHCHGAGLLVPNARGLHEVATTTSANAYVDRVSRALARAGPGAVVSRESAARLLSIAGAPAVGPITLTIPKARNAPRLPGIDIQRADVPAEDMDEVAELPVTSPLRTVLDCARHSDRLTAVCLLESAARLGQASIDDVAARVEALTRAPGVRAARIALESVDLRSESPLETAVRLPLLDAGLPYPELQLPFAYGKVKGRIDLAYPLALLGGSSGRYVGLAIEADGRAPHEADAETFHRDRARQTVLEEHGWLVRRFTDRHARQATAYMVAVVRRAIDRVLQP